MKQIVLPVTIHLNIRLLLSPVQPEPADTANCNCSEVQHGL